MPTHYRMIGNGILKGLRCSAEAIVAFCRMKSADVEGCITILRFDPKCCLAEHDGQQGVGQSRLSAHTSVVLPWQPVAIICANGNATQPADKIYSLNLGITEEDFHVITWFTSCAVDAHHFSELSDDSY